MGSEALWPATGRTQRVRTSQRETVLRRCQRGCPTPSLSLSTIACITASWTEVHPRNGLRYICQSVDGYRLDQATLYPNLRPFSPPENRSLSLLLHPAPRIGVLCSVADSSYLLYKAVRKRENPDASIDLSVRGGFGCLTLFHVQQLLIHACRPSVC